MDCLTSMAIRSDIEVLQICHMTWSHVVPLLFFTPSGLSSLASGWVANRFGLVNTMVFTHLPSNILLLLVPLMPNLGLATVMLFLR